MQVQRKCYLEKDLNEAKTLDITMEYERLKGNINDLTFQN